MKQRIFEVIGLQSPRGRLTAFIIASGLIYISKYNWFSDLSLWKRIGWESAPSIGLTRAYWLVLHGEFSAAWQRNWLIYPVLIIVLALLAIDITKMRRSDD